MVFKGNPPYFNSLHCNRALPTATGTWTANARFQLIGPEVEEMGIVSILILVGRPSAKRR